MSENNTKRDRLLIELTRIERRLRKLYGDTYRAAVEIKAVRKAIEEGQEFTWDGNPAAAKQLQSLLDTMAQQTNAYLRNATSKAWTEGEKGVHNTLAAVFATTKKSEEEIERITEKAREDMRKRGASGHNYFNEKRGGLTISDRVWNISDTARNEIETIIQNGILEGKNPDQIAKSVQPYLREPHKLFRRVRNKETGELELSQAAKKYKPGRGVYRSSYKNAMRLVRTEVTAAYRRAEWETYQNNPLITGFRIELSNNHTTLVKGVPVPFHDICDEMVGVYPKTFKWTGWHPQCRCRMIPVFISKADFKDRMKALAAGKLKDWKPKKATTDMPENFKKWIQDNSDRIAAAGGATQKSQRGNETPLRKIEDEVAAGIQYDPKGAKEINITGWRKKTSGEGTAGTFYYHDKYEYLQDNKAYFNKHLLKFKRALIITDPDVEAFEGLPLEYLFGKWNPDYPLVQVAKSLGMETGQLIDKIVTRQAIAKGYDALIMGEMEIIDLRSHYAFKAATQTQTIRNWKGLPYWMQDNQGTINSILNLTPATGGAAAKPFVLDRKMKRLPKNK